MRSILKYLMLLLLAGLAAGCGDGPSETAHPLFVKYRKARTERNYPEAAEYLKRYLKVRPESKVAHLELASLYDENIDDPLAAIYHYRTFLEADSHSPQRHDAARWLEAAERKYYNHTRLKLNDPEDVVSLQDSLHETEQGLRLAQTENRRLLGLVNEYRDQIAKLDYDLKLKAIQATDVSILKEQLRESSANVRQLEVYRDALTREDKNKEQRLAELRRSMDTQNRIIEDLRAKLAASEKEAAKIPEMLTQYRALEQARQQLEKELTELRRRSAVPTVTPNPALNTINPLPKAEDQTP